MPSPQAAWSGHPALPIRALLAADINWPKNVALFLTRIGAPTDAAFAERESALLRPAVAKLPLLARDVKTGQASDAIRAFSSRLAEEKLVNRASEKLSAPST
jgi:hypothetical protein